MFVCIYVFTPPPPSLPLCPPLSPSAPLCPCFDQVISSWRGYSGMLSGTRMFIGQLAKMVGPEPMETSNGNNTLLNTYIVSHPTGHAPFPLATPSYLSLLNTYIVSHPTGHSPFPLATPSYLSPNNTLLNTYIVSHPTGHALLPEPIRNPCHFESLRGRVFADSALFPHRLTRARSSSWKCSTTCW